MREMKETLSEHNLYGNIEVYSPDDELMFYSNMGRLKFYLKHDLVTEIGEKKYKLKFVPNGRGRAGTSIPPVLRENKCVVSGRTDNLTKHHIVPQLFRNFLPLSVKTCSLTVVLLNVEEHRKYTEKEVKFYEILATYYKAPSYSSFHAKQNFHRRARKLAMMLDGKWKMNLPEERKLEMMKEFEAISGLEATLGNYQTIIDDKSNYAAEFGKEIVSRVTDFYEFEKIWYDHFTVTMEPKYLPQDLILKFK